MSVEEVQIKRFKDDTDTLQHCAHWVQRKKRFCKMTLAKDSIYCGEHKPVEAAQAQENPNNIRIPCPLDNKHTVYRNKLKKHLKICNARKKDEECSYVVKNINAGDGEEHEKLANFDQLKLSNVEDEEFYDIIKTVKQIYAKYVEGTIDLLQLQHKLLDSELCKTEYGKESRKHLLQTAALLGILEHAKQLQANTSYIEFGAGKGQLAYFLAQLLQQHDQSQVILLDRMSLRHKKDNKVEDRSLVHRIRVDIADLYLPGVELLHKTKRLVAFSKHLCGGATDLTLRCITQKNNNNITDNALRIEYIMIALCCHHRCDWNSFVGKSFLLRHGIDARKFSIITKMVGWAICGTGLSRERRRDLAEQRISSEITHDINTTQRLSLSEREKIGFMCKRILDYARIEYLRENGYEASLKCYVPKDVTLENVCLLANKINN